MISRKPTKKIWCGVLISFFFCFLLLSFDYSTLHGSKNGVRFSDDPFLHVNNKTSIQTNQPNRDQKISKKSNTHSCSGRYIFIQDIPSRFNYDLFKNCHSLTIGTDKDMCPYLVNLGFGPKLENSEGVFSNMSWFKTNQFMLEIIFHNKMKNYDCLTNDPSSASAIYVPYYPGLDVMPFLFYQHIPVRSRDSSAQEFVKWIARKPEWNRMWGRDHFLVAGRVSWDFRRQTESNLEWGSKFRFLPESRNMTMLSIESADWTNDIAIPYPTHLHPLNDNEIVQWRDRMRKQRRPYLFTFVGSTRIEARGAMRGFIIDQCVASNGCKFVNCSSGEINCDDTFSVMRVFQMSVFCLQPPGDTYTRRSIFDSILAGCIPVFFHPRTAYTQYLWHFPQNHNTYSVYIPIENHEDWKGSIEKILLRVSKERELSMREKVIGLIPEIVYADPRSSLRSFEDAFDIAVKKVLERIESVRRKIRERRDPSDGFAEVEDYRVKYF